MSKANVEAKLHDLIDAIEEEYGDACECEFYHEYQRHRFGDEDDFEQSDSTDR